jgi:hypothetical protein
MDSEAKYSINDRIWEDLFYKSHCIIVTHYQKIIEAVRKTPYVAINHTLPTYHALQTKMIDNKKTVADKDVKNAT